MSLRLVLARVQEPRSALGPGDLHPVLGPVSRLLRQLRDDQTLGLERGREAAEGVAGRRSARRIGGRRSGRGIIVVVPAAPADRRSQPLRSGRAGSVDYESRQGGLSRRARARASHQSDEIAATYSGISQSGNQRASSSSQGLVASWALRRSSRSLSRFACRAPGTKG